MAASAEYELEKRVERLELFPVELEKGERPGHSKEHTGDFCGASLCSASLVGAHILDFCLQHLLIVLGIPCQHPWPLVSPVYGQGVILGEHISYVPCMWSWTLLEAQGWVKAVSKARSGDTRL